MIDAFIAGASIMALSVTGAVVFGKQSLVEKIHLFILPSAVGVFLGVAFFELIPETLVASPEWGPLTIIFGFLCFYLLAHFLETFHHHHTDDHDHCAHNGARMLLIGDGIHNIADGVVIASAFMLNPLIGTITAVGIALHEIPQEIAEFGILLKSGYSKKKALFYNLISASGILIGVACTFLFTETFTQLTFILTGVTAGNLLYIAASDLIPELRHSHRNHFAKTFLATLLGVTLIGLLTHYAHALSL